MADWTMDGTSCLVDGFHVIANLGEKRSVELAQPGSTIGKSQPLFHRTLSRLVLTGRVAVCAEPGQSGIP